MKKYLSVLFLIAFVVPSVALASWWNPLSWFNKNTNKIPTIETPRGESQSNLVIPTPVESTATLTSPVETSSEPESHKVIQDTKIIEKIVEKPVIKTQTITVQDPTLQAKIDALIAENNSLKSQITKLQTSNRSLGGDILSCENRISSSTTNCMNPFIGTTTSSTPKVSKGQLFISLANNGAQVTLARYIKDSTELEVIYPESLQPARDSFECFPKNSNGQILCTKSKFFMPLNGTLSNSPDFPDEALYNFTIKAYSEIYTANLTKNSDKTFFTDQ